MSGTKFLTMKEVAQRWQVSTRHVQRMIERGDLAVHRQGRLVRISIEDLVMAEARMRASSTVFT